ncbi:MAG: Fe-S cluster assembly ATPase SufC [Candidatus Aenigmarchaeota archaeon]|nr:Fe-S cluster assembly ATPase SufC [Candidatus Aenigmarchaeota archaeon]
MLEIKDLHVSIDGKEIIKGVNLKVEKGKIHAIMGPNGSGKSTLANVLMGHPKYKVEKGSITFDGKNVLVMTPDQRAKAGMFLAFQYPVEVAGVSLFNFLRAAYNSINNGHAKNIEKEVISVLDFQKLLKEKVKLLQMDESFIYRHLNEGFSGGEKKRVEILQLAVLNPKIAILDETDSGLDIDSVKIVANGVNDLKGTDMGVLLITHYQRILKYIKPDYVHVMINGKIVKSGGEDLAEQLEQKGYDWIKEGIE